MPNWTPPGPDFVQGFWLKNFWSMHQVITHQLESCLQEAEIPAWMTAGRPVLIQKDKSKGKVASNYRPITRLPLVWKLLTGVLADEIYEFLESNNILEEEQKGCKKNSRGTHDSLFIDRMVMREAKLNQRNLAVACLDYRKPYDLVPHSWLLDCIDMFVVAEEINRFLRNSMKTWNVELTSNVSILGNVPIRRGILQGDTLSPLLFVLSMTPFSLVLRKARFSYEIGEDKTRINHVFFMDDLI